MPAITKFHNRPPAVVADELGELHFRIKALQAEAKDLKAELEARGITEVTTDRYSIKRVEATRWSLDTKAIRAEMGDAWATKRSSVSNVVSYRIDVSAQAKQAA
jgi:hypothetical protein